MSTVAVLDIGKTNVKLTVATREGVILETVSTANSPVPGPPYIHPDIEGIEGWFFDQLRVLARRHGVGAVVATCHGSANALVDDQGVVDADDRLRAGAAGRGQSCLPERDRAARHLWQPDHAGQQPRRPPAPVAARRSGPKPSPAPVTFSVARNTGPGDSPGPPRPSSPISARSRISGTCAHGASRRSLSCMAGSGYCRKYSRHGRASGGSSRSSAAATTSPATIEVICGIHDSSANFYRCQQAGFEKLALISTGTFLVGIADIARPEEFVVTSERICNADVLGRPLAGVLAMGGREFAIIAGEGDRAARASDHRGHRRRRNHGAALLCLSRRPLSRQCRPRPHRRAGAEDPGGAAGAGAASMSRCSPMPASK